MAHTGRLNSVDINNVSKVSVRAAINVRSGRVCLIHRITIADPGIRNPITANASRFAYQVFRFVKAEGEKTKFKR